MIAHEVGVCQSRFGDVFFLATPMSVGYLQRAFSSQPVVSIPEPAVPELQNAHALVIGIADYQYVRKLPPVRDAQDVAAVLADAAICGYPPNNVRSLVEAQATRDAIRRELADLAARSDADSTAFIYFSGHGGRIESGPCAGQYLLAVGTV